MTSYFCQKHVCTFTIFELEWFSQSSTKALVAVAGTIWVLSEDNFLLLSQKHIFCLVYLSSLSEWDVIEWSDDQAIFTFLYDTIELVITFGEPVGE